MDIYPKLYEDAIKRITRLEDHLFNGGKGMVYKVSNLENLATQIQKETAILNEIENRLIVIEERVARQAENLRLRQFSTLLNAYPYGWKGIFITWMLATALISQIVEVADLHKIIANFLGAK